MGAVHAASAEETARPGGEPYAVQVAAGCKGLDEQQVEQRPARRVVCVGAIGRLGQRPTSRARSWARLRLSAARTAASAFSTSGSWR